MEKLYQQGLLSFIQGKGKENLLYFDSNILNKALADATPHEPDDIELIAFCLAINNPENITGRDVLVFSQTLDVLRQYKEQKTLMSRWATKAKISQQNPDSIKYIMNMSKAEVLKEKNKMKRVEKEDLKVEPQASGSKKRRQEETVGKRIDHRQQDSLVNTDSNATKEKFGS